MNQHLQTITNFIEQQENIPSEQKSLLLKAVKDADYALTIAEFKLERTEKVKRTTAILLEETIEGSHADLQVTLQAEAQPRVPIDPLLEVLYLNEALLVAGADTNGWKYEQ